MLNKMNECRAGNAQGKVKQSERRGPNGVEMRMRVWPSRVEAQQVAAPLTVTPMALWSLQILMLVRKARLGQAAAQQLNPRASMQGYYYI